MRGIVLVPSTTTLEPLGSKLITAFETVIGYPPGESVCHAMIYAEAVGAGGS